MAVRDLLERPLGRRSRLRWLIGRIVYFVGYLSNPDGRFPGFFIQAAAHFALMLGALGRIIYLAM